MPADAAAASEAASAWAMQQLPAPEPVRIGCMDKGICRWTGPLALRRELLGAAAVALMVALLIYRSSTALAKRGCKNYLSGRLTMILLMASWCAWAALDVFRRHSLAITAEYVVVRSHVQLVIASCNSNLTWTSILPAALLQDVVVLEKCGHFSPRGDITATRKGDPIPGKGQVKPGSVEEQSAARPPSFTYLGVTPNNGREGMAYLWYITHGWDSLRTYTVFLQGDAQRHTPLAERPHSAGSLILQLIAAGATYSSLGNCCVPSHNAHFRQWSMRLECEIYRNFTHAPAAVCYPWVGAPFATFLVRRDAIHRHQWSTFHNLLRHFTEPGNLPSQWEGKNSHFDPSNIAGVVIERSWSLIFGCSRPLLRGIPAANCSFGPETSTAELRGRCAHAFRPLSGGTGPLVRGEYRAETCLAVHNMSEQLFIEERRRQPRHARVQLGS